MGSIVSGFFGEQDIQGDRRVLPIISEEFLIKVLLSILAKFWDRIFWDYLLF
jgi:hypothetical protein